MFLITFEYSIPTKHPWIGCNPCRIVRSNAISSTLIASKATTDAIIAYHTALELHGIAYTTFLI